MPILWGLPALGSRTRPAGNPPSFHLGLLEERIPRAPEFMAMFILSKT